MDNDRKKPLGAGFELEGQYREPLLSRADTWVLLILASLVIGLLVFLLVDVHRAVSAAFSMP